MTDWTVVKKGWVYQRRKTLVFTSWSPKYMVLYSTPFPALALYEQRSDALPPYAPLVHLDLNGVTVCPITKSESWPKKLWHALVHSNENMAKERSESISSSSQFSSQPSSRRGSVSDAKSAAAGMATTVTVRNQAMSISRPAFNNQPAIKLVLDLSSTEERDEWVQKINDAIAAMHALQEAAEQAASTSPLPPVDLPAAAPVEERPRPAPPVGMMGLGVTLISHGRLQRLITNQPLEVVDENSSVEAEICLSQIVDKNPNGAINKPGSDSSPGDALVLAYQQAMSDRRKAANDVERMSIELKTSRIVGHFHDIAIRHARELVDGFHSRSALAQGMIGARSAAPNNGVYEFGPLKLQFIIDYQQVADEDTVDLASALIRQEMNAIRWVNQQTRTDVHTSLMTVIEYKGFHIMAHIPLPFTEETLAFDITSDDRPPIVKDHVVDVLRLLAQDLNLQSGYPWRLSDGRAIQMSLNPSIEVHQVVGKHPRGIALPGFHLMNMHEMVPVWPAGVEQDLQPAPGYYRFRPEFVQSHSTPLPTTDMGPEKCLSAFKSLTEVIIPNFIDDLENLKILPLDSGDWRNVLHQNGINCVFLGRIAQQIRLPHVREQLQIEMTARTVKRLLRSKLRRVILHFKEVQALKVDEELHTIVLQTFNTLLGNDSKNGAGNGWSIELAASIYEKYDYKLDAEMYRHLSKPALYLALQHHCGVQFVDKPYDFAIEEPFKQSEFVQFVPKMEAGPISWSFTEDPAKNSFATSTGNSRSEKIGSIIKPSASMVKTQRGTLAVDPRVVEGRLLHALGQETLSLGEMAWQVTSKRIAICRDFLALSQFQCSQKLWNEASKYLSFARNVAPKVHAIRALIEMQAAEQRLLQFGSVASKHHQHHNLPLTSSGQGGSATAASSSRSVEHNGNNNAALSANSPSSSSNAARRDHYTGDAELRRSYSAAIAAVDAHLGPHHPLVIMTHEKMAELLIIMGQGKPASMVNSILSESLMARQSALAASIKALGRSHRWSRSQVIKIGELHQKLGNFEEAINFFHDALKAANQYGDTIELKALILLYLAQCHQSKDDIEDALAQAQKARVLLENDNSSSSEKGTISASVDASLTGTNIGNIQMDFLTVTTQTAAVLLEEVYALIAILAQKIYEDVSGDSNQVVTDSMMTQLNLAVECYERLFDAQRQKATVDGEKLVALLRQITILKLRLAKPSQRVVINSLKSKRQPHGNNNVSSASYNDAQMREVVMRMVTAQSPAGYVEKLLERIEKSGNLGLAEVKDSVEELAIIIEIAESTTAHPLHSNSHHN